MSNIKNKKIVTQVDGFKLHQEIPEFDFGIIINFEKVDGVWYVDIRDDDGASRVSIEELKEIVG
jgi:hypothetical protein